MLVKTFGNNEKIIRKNILKLNLEQKIKSLLYDHLLREQIFDSFMISLPNKTENVL